MAKLRAKQKIEAPPKSTRDKRQKEEMTEENCLKILAKYRIKPTDDMFDFSKGSKHRLPQPGLKLIRRLDYLERVHNYVIIWN